MSNTQTSGSKITVGTQVRILASDEGYRGKIGTVCTVFASGSVQVLVGPVAMLYMKPDQLEIVENETL